MVPPIRYSAQTISLFVALLSLSNILWAQDDSLTIASVGIYVNRIDEINVKDQSFNCDFYLYLQWRGKYSPRRYEFINGFDVSKRYETIEEGENGAKTLSVRVQGTFFVPMDISEYPFDTHRLEIIVENYDWSASHLLFEHNMDFSGTENMQYEGGWDIVGADHSIGLRQMDNDGETFSRYVAIIEVERQITSFFVKIIVPLIMVVLMSMLNFYLPAKEIESQISLGATALLSIIAFNFVIADQLPSVGYLTKADYAILMSYIFVFSALVESVMTHWLFKREQEALARRLDKRSRVLFPILYAVSLGAIAVS